MAQLMDIRENRLKFSDGLPSGIDPHFTRWLKRLTEPRVSDRFADAVEALEGLEPSNNGIDIIVFERAKKTNYQIFKQSRSLALCFRLLIVSLFPPLINFVLVESTKIYLPHEVELTSMVFISYFMRILYSTSNITLIGGALSFPILLFLDLISPSQKKEIAR
jgi:hypothetical protein